MDHATVLIDVNSFHNMGYSKTSIILPGYGLDNLPYDINDEQSEGLLNAFAVACHPAVLAQTERLPVWSSCDEHADADPATLYFIPQVSEDHLHGVWTTGDEAGPGVIRGINQRDELVAAVLADLETNADSIDKELAADCMSIGIAHALMEMLTQHMHYFSNVDAEVLEQNAVAAAKAIVAGSNAEAKQKLTTAFEVLVEARERFYPVDCYLLDLCLLNAEEANQHIERTLSMGGPINFLIDGTQLDEFTTQTTDRIRQALKAPNPDEFSQAAILGGELNSVAAPLVPLADWLHDFQAGLEGFGAKLGQLPHTWARKRFGFSTLLPQVLDTFAYKSALHFALDDGTFPDAEHSKFSWEGCDGTSIDAVSRIPIAIESASSLLRLPERIAESMQEDMVAAILFARWPKLKTTWLEDFQRIQRYGDVFGRFVTFTEFAADSGDTGTQLRHEAREYLSPFLIQGSALGQPRPISRFTQSHQQRANLDAAIACRAIGRLIANTNEIDNERAAVENQLATADEQEPQTPELTAAIDALAASAVKDLASICGADPGQTDGVFVFNPLSFARKCVVPIPKDKGTAVVDVPALGFVWVNAPTIPGPPPKTPLASKTLLHNGMFEVHINEESGGISTIKGFARSPNRLSQQLGFRFESPHTIGTYENGDPVKTSYSNMVCQQIEVTRCDAVVGEVRCTGQLTDPRDQSRLADFTQTVRVVHGSPFVDIEIELANVEHNPQGNPWLTYYGCRFAWNDSAAALTRSVFGQAHGFSGERFESPHYLEIASDDLRTTIISHGLPFHRKTDMRMADSLLVVEGEQQRSFRFTIAIDQKYPQQAALHAMTPPLVVPTGEPRAGASGWFAQLSSKNVIVTEYPQNVVPNASMFTLRLLETEGRSATTKIAFFKPAKSAWKTDFHGNQRQQLVVSENGIVTIDMRKYELTDVRIEFS